MPLGSLDWGALPIYRLYCVIDILHFKLENKIKKAEHSILLEYSALFFLL